MNYSVKYIREFNGLRGLLALWVVLGHLTVLFALPNPIFTTRLYDKYAVQIFIILSGFSIASLLDHSSDNYRSYIIRRVLRIFPVYWLFLVPSVALAGFTLTTWTEAPHGYFYDVLVGVSKNSVEYFYPHLLAHVFALQGVVPPAILPDTDFAFIGQAWSLSLEWQFYLVAPLFVPWVLRPLGGTAKSIGMTFAILLSLIIARRMPTGFIGSSLQFFILGILTFKFLKERFSEISIDASIAVRNLFAISVAVLISLRTSAITPYVIWIAVVCVVISNRENTSKVNVAISNFFNSPIIQGLGDMAYSVYLGHILILEFVIRFMLLLNIKDTMIQAFFLTGIGLPAIMLISRLSYIFVERPFHELGKSISLRQFP